MFRRPKSPDAVKAKAAQVQPDEAGAEADGPRPGGESPKVPVAPAKKKRASVTATQAPAATTRSEAESAQPPLRSDSGGEAKAEPAQVQSDAAGAKAGTPRPGGRSARGRAAATAGQASAALLQSEAESAKPPTQFPSDAAGATADASRPGRRSTRPRARPESGDRAAAPATQAPAALTQGEAEPKRRPDAGDEVKAEPTRVRSVEAAAAEAGTPRSGRRGEKVREQTAGTGEPPPAAIAERQAQPAGRIRRTAPGRTAGLDAAPGEANPPSAAETPAPSDVPQPQPTAKPAKARVRAKGRAGQSVTPPEAVAERGTVASLPGAREPRSGARRNGDKAASRARTSRGKSSSAKRPSARRRVPRYLAAELGQPVDHAGEPIGAGSALSHSDTALLEYTLRLWRQMQFGNPLKEPIKAVERAGFTVDDLWAAGVTETLPTSSSAEEVRRYKQKLLFRANLLEALLTETVADLHRLDRTQPTRSEVAHEQAPAQVAVKAD